MKKSLKVIASAAMVFSMFASVAMADTAPASSTTISTSTTAPAVKTSASFTDLANVDAGLKAKIDALLAKGWFEGVSDTEFGINQNMTRAQAAKLVDEIFGVTVDTSVTTSSFSDVVASDAANGWAIPYIEAAKKAGLIDGVTDTTFVPGDNVTLGQLATLLVKGMGKTVDVSGSPWYADAVKQAVALNILPANADGSAAATRADLVNASFGADQAFQATQKASVSDAKATGAQKVTVDFNKAVDATKATLALKKGTVSVATTATFAQDGKSAVLTLTDTKLSAGDYTVTLGGIDNIGTATATFTAQDEVVQKIEFVNSSDTIAKTAAAGKYVNVKVKASNQYGENASFSAGSYSVLSNGKGVVSNKLSKDADGNLIVGLDTSAQDIGIGVVSVTVINNDSHVTATKNFTVGTAPLLSKVELGSPVYSVGTALSDVGQNVKFALNMFDQYGNLISYDQLGANPTDIPLPQVIWNDYIDPANVNVATEDDGNGNPELKISLAKNVDKTGDYNFTVIDQAASTSGKLSIQSSKIANKVAIGDLGDVIAAHDKDVYIPVVGYDAQGNQLSTDDLVSAVNLGRINVSVAGADNANVVAGQGQLEPAGEHKGTIHLQNISGTKNGAVSVNVFIATANASSNASKTYTIQAARTPDHIKIATAPAASATVGAHTSFEFLVIDQYGKQLDTSWNVDSQGNYVGTANSGDHYSVKVAVTGTGAGFVNADSDTISPIFTAPTVFGNAQGGATYNSATSAAAAADFTSEAASGDFVNFNKTFRFYAGAAGDTNTITATLEKNGLEVSKVQKTLTTVQAVDSLNYSVNTVPALFNAIDSGVIVDGVTYYSSDAATAAGAAKSLTAAEQKDQLVTTEASKFAREVTVSAIAANGDTVALPHNITAIASSNTSIAQVAFNNGQAWVVGNKAGTAAITVSYKANDGTIKTSTTNITVKNDTLSVTGVSFDDASKTRKVGSSAFAGVNITDNYGVTYEDGDAAKYNYLLGTTFSIAHVKNGNASVDQYGVITGDAGATFDLTITSATGQTATQAVPLN